MFQRGDKVRHAQGDTGRIISIDGGYALVQWNGNAIPRQCSIASLTHDTEVVL